MRSAKARPRLTSLAFIAALCLRGAAVRADGGALCLSERQGDYEIAVFTAPTPLRAGPVDVSVLIQNADTHQPVREGRVMIEATRSDRPGLVIRRRATNEAATNKLLQAATLDLNQPGTWRVELKVDGPSGDAAFNCDVEVAEPLPEYLTMWRWLAWPVVPIVLFGTHQFLAKRSCSRTHAGAARSPAGNQ